MHPSRSIPIECSTKAPRQRANAAGAVAEPDWAGPAWLIVHAALTAAKIRSAAPEVRAASAGVITPSGGGRTGTPFHPITVGSSGPRECASRRQNPSSASGAAGTSRSRRTSLTRFGANAGSVRLHARSDGWQLARAPRSAWSAHGAGKLSRFSPIACPERIRQNSAATSASQPHVTRDTRPRISGSADRPSTRNGERPSLNVTTTHARHAARAGASSTPITSSPSRSSLSCGSTSTTAARCASRAIAPLTPTAQGGGAAGARKQALSSYLGTGTGF